MPGRRMLIGGALAAAAIRPAASQAWPDRPIRIIAPYAPGGQSDTVVRLLAPKMAEHLGQGIVIENRTGAGGSIGAGAVAQSPADGHTLLFESFAFLVVPFIVKGLTFDYETAFAPVGQAVALPYVLVVRHDFPAQDVAGFRAYAKAHPGVSYGTPGIGTVGHLAGALLERRAGIRLEHIPYRGGAESARDLAGGVIDAAIGTANTFGPLIQDGKVRGLALTSGERRGSLRSLPTIAESGFPGYDLTSWNGLFAPAGTPAPVMARLEAALLAATGDPATQERLTMAGNDVVTEGSAAFAARIQRERAVVKQIVAQTGLRAE
ncbi:tripartite tricarboxylate transporter substrate binding protein [Belnapia sp. T18]|uniref:Tripartite tricarboxylate transporter substrate binding protein n=1 Tax=Belnapia arida TaxID=2804533 RepID=A0ABS1U3C6_9PROT|nr:tripartite tricarboxylate transporter substrate binding protein [Belnapia arida]MBL6079169.1 tripartite tricarboxylate transporter substrate binding protein [Belnapia arida]